ncbi:MAG: LLM class F420-dependent oxidoreductase [Acidimicrobiia bacterium]|nr:LLM class F420-dependent oxidoreductase [Acidimicrobiia bacterium]
MTHPVRIALQIHPQHAEYGAIREAVLHAEELGVDIVYDWDHFYPLYGDPDGPHFEAWTMLGAWAEQTSRIRIGCLVTCNSYRNPNLLADMARTVDHIAEGRLIFGIGSGWFRRDYESYGYEFGTAGSRLDALARDLPIIRDRWTELNPGPVGDMPVLVGGVGPRKTMRILANHGDAWHAMFPDRPEDLRVAIDALEGWCGEIGRDPHEIEWGVGMEPDDRARFLHDDADTYLEMGFTQFTIGANGPDYPFDVVEDWLAWRDEQNA